MFFEIIFESSCYHSKPQYQALVANPCYFAGSSQCPAVRSNASRPVSTEHLVAEPQDTSKSNTHL